MLPDDTSYSRIMSRNSVDLPHPTKDTQGIAEKLVEVDFAVRYGIDGVLTTAATLHPLAHLVGQQCLVLRLAAM
jgi:hypothetical protein